MYGFKILKSDNHLINSDLDTLPDKLPRILGNLSSCYDYPLRRYEVEYNIKNRDFFLLFFEKRKYPYRRYLREAINSSFKRELQLFCISLDAYKESGGPIPLGEIIKLNSLGSRGSKILKQLRSYTFENIINATYYQDRDLDPLVKILYNRYLKFTEDIDEVFNFRHCIMWEEECNDYVWGDEPVIQDEVILKKFRDKLRDIIRDIPKPTCDNRWEIVFNQTSSRTLKEDNPLETMYTFEKKIYKKVEENFDYKISPAKRCVIPVYPGGYRDTVILPPKSVNTVRFIEDRVCYFLSYLDGHLYTSNKTQFDREIKDFFKEKRGFIYICRDIRKEGITKPRNLLKIMLEELSKKDELLLPFISFYDSFKVDNHVPLRGHGCGMANALTTLMQVVISNLVYEEFQLLGYDNAFQTLSYNDDNVVKVEADLHLDYWDLEGEVISGLGIIRAEDKSYYSPQGYVFCENYFSLTRPNINARIYTQTREILIIFLWDFPYEAKQYLESICKIPMIPKYFDEILDEFGYEFYPREHQVSISLGGWIPDFESGFSRTLLDLPSLSYNKKIPAGYYASRITSITANPPKKLKGKFKNYIQNISRIVDYEDVRYIPSGNFKKVYNFFELWRNDRNLSRIYKYRVHLRRRKEYLKYRNNDISYAQFKDILSRDPRMLLPREYLKMKDPDEFIKIQRDPYIQKTPLLNYLVKIGFPSDFPTRFCEEYSISKKKKQDHCKLRQLIYYDEEDEFMEYLPINHELFIEASIKTDFIRFIGAHYKLYQQFCVPNFDIVVPFKEEVFSGYLPLDCYTYFANIPAGQWDVRLYFKYMDLLSKYGSMVEEVLPEILDESEEETIYTDQEQTEESKLYNQIREFMKEKKIYNFSKAYALYLQEEKKIPSIDEGVSLLIGSSDNFDEFKHEFEFRQMRSTILTYYSCLVGRQNREQRFLESYHSHVEDFPEIETYLREAVNRGFLKDIGEVLGWGRPPDQEDDNLLGDFF